jgi:hypothetical protein
LKLTVDGKIYTQTVAVHNDPRVGENAATLNALKSQHALTMAAYNAMKDSYSANEEVAAARAQVASLQMRAALLPPDIATKARELDAKLATFGGAIERRGGRGGFGGGRGNAAPGAMQSFIALNNSFSALVSMVQVGLDMAPTQAQTETFESDCRNYNTTLAAWKKTAAEDLAAFSAELNKSNVPPLTFETATKLAPASCSLLPAPAPSARQ